MPAPATHVVYAQRFLDRRPELDEGAFLRGTLFPDIRFLRVLKREQTHRFGVELAEVAAEPDAWRAGSLLHSWLDEAWVVFFEQFGLVRDAPEDAKTLGALKMVEADWVWPKLRHPGAMKGLLSGVDDEALAFGVAADVVGQWGSLMGEAVSREPDLDLQVELLRRLGFDEAVTARAAVEVGRLRADAVWVERIERCWVELGGLIDLV